MKGRPKEHINPEIGKRFATVRKTLKLSQSQFAEIFFVTEQTIGNWENGRRKIPNEILEQISKEFSISLNFLLCKEDDEKYTKHDFSKFNITNPKELARLDLYRYFEKSGYDTSIFDDSFIEDIEDYIEYSYHKRKKPLFQLVGTYTKTGSAILEYKESVYILEGWSEETEQFENAIEVNDDGTESDRLYTIKPQYKDNGDALEIVNYEIKRKDG